MWLWLWANAGRGLSHAVRQGSTAPTPRQVGSTDFRRLWLLRLEFAARSPRAFRPVGYRPTAHEARAPGSADLSWLCCGLTRGALLPTPSAGARPHQHQDRPAARALDDRGPRGHIRWRVSGAHIAPWSIDRPLTEHARCAVRAWLGCCGPTRAALLPTPSAGAQPRQHRDRSAARESKFMIIMFDSRGAHLARFPPP